MVNYMVAVDGSKSAKAAFYTALFMMDPNRDTLYVIGVTEKISNYYPHAYISEKVDSLVQEQAKQETRAILSSYRRLCHAKGLKNYTAILAVSNHVGEMIVQQAEVKKVDFLIIGRRGMSTLKRLFVGSTSKYCLEHANCSVLVVKGEWGPAEQHVSLSEIDKLEEEERKRRIEEHEKQTKEHGTQYGVGMPLHLQEIAKDVESKSKDDKTEHAPHEEIHQEFK